jgi:pyrroline-5-carboxylate reductase
MTTGGLATRCIGFVGGGNMAEALVRGLLESGATSTAQLRVSDPSEARRDHLMQQYGIETTTDNAVLASWADVVVLAVKPGIVRGACEAIADALGTDAQVLSIAAGVPIKSIEKYLNDNTRVVRAMPNTAAMALAGASAVASGSHAGPEDLEVARLLFESVGRCVVVPEKLLDAVTGLSGSGPAYVMLFIEALADGGVKAGLPRDVALTLASQTVYGAAKLQIETGEHPGVLKDRVTSPGGTTIAGLAKLEAGGVRGVVIAAVDAATQRSIELGS